MCVLLASQDGGLGSSQSVHDAMIPPQPDIAGMFAKPDEVETPFRGGPMHGFVTIFKITGSTVLSSFRPLLI